MKNDFEQIQLLKDINERNEIVKKYLSTGFLDRENAISKIMKLRLQDKNVAEITTIKLAQNATPFSMATNEQIVEELKMQVGILESKFLMNK